MSSRTDIISISSLTKSERSKSVSSCIAPTTDAPEIAIATRRTATCCFLCSCSKGFVRFVKRSGDIDFDCLPLSNTTCRAPMSSVEERNAQMTPNANAIPKVARGGRGEMMLARKAATVVTTASVNGTLSFPHALIHASAVSSTFSLISERARCKWIA